MTLCRSCGESFTGERIFDLHRVGVHAFTFPEGLALDPPREDGRRCLDSEQMTDRGWERDERGRWHDPARTLAARESFGRSRSRGAL